jgi:catechol 2,3-dioxygenase-like lactoylglutathione lyase family enzyme
MIDIKRFDHIGMVVPDLEQQTGLLSGLFGFRQTHTWDRDGGARGALFDVPGKTGVQWEVLSPAGGGPLQEFIDGPNGPGLHHVTIEVPDATAAASELQGDGVQPTVNGRRVAIGPDAGGEGFTFQLRSFGDTGPCTNGADVTSIQPPGGTENTLGIVAIDHICHAYPNRDELARKFGHMFGMRQIWRTPDGEHPDFADLVLETPAQLLWEVIMPKGDESFIQRFLDKRGPSIHHIAFEVADWDTAIAACEFHGIPVFDESTGETDGAKWRDIFIHPKHTGGMLVQFFWEEKPGVWIRSDKVRLEGFAPRWHLPHAD